MEETKLEALLEEAMTHCYDEEDEFWGVFSVLVGRVSYPLQARMHDETVTLVGLDGNASDLQVGVMVRVQAGDEEQSVALADLEVVDADPASAEWLAVYRHWWGKRGR